ncbi:response regulator transcription factor [Pseudorhizobium banfieldiae]|uniref:response regulator transcription factor n=1 Tax=Pseudorhizobium banfieldiae TaxID=1125847 RepID=UPI0006987BE6|nr:response regulator transcription factor [Pseudorhizobium banfieldiae]CAD6631206.1 DNA-binding response regulator [arsenite-oxidising bacterium NT-25]
MLTALLVLSNQELAGVLSESLAREGYSTFHVLSATNLQLQPMLKAIDVIVLEGSSSEGGAALCTKLRLATPAPILVLSIAGMERQWAGVADDVIERPFAVQDLLARIGALLDRGRSRPRTIFSWGDISMNIETHRVTRGGHIIDLGLMEFRLLHLLLTEPHRVWSRLEILERLWSVDRGERMVDVAVKRLRASLNSEGEIDAIRTVRGSGYGLA